MTCNTVLMIFCSLPGARVPAPRPEGQVHQVDEDPLRPFAGRLPVQPVPHPGRLPGHGGQGEEGVRNLCRTAQGTVID